MASHDDSLSPPSAADALDAATNGLYRRTPEYSAAITLVPWQAGALCASGAFVLAAALVDAPAAAGALQGAASLFFLCVIAFRFFLFGVAMKVRKPSRLSRSAAMPDDAALPCVTILLPLYDEADALPTLFDAIDALDYPAERLDVKVILEESDARTIAEARRLGLDQRHDLVLTPKSAPQTKPKACNYGLQFARGDLVVIYDAEDLPAPGQLREAAAAFAQADERLACVQAPLNFYNARENLLTRLFALEYALWFDSLLPALEALGAPIPLGGTSNVFRRSALVAVGGWDPYNVTEDADLGLRLARFGYRTQMIEAATLEEANCRVGNWMRQRSRWLKGYMQTWLVQMRAPLAFHRALGLRGAATLHFFLGGAVASALATPFCFLAAAAFLAGDGGATCGFLAFTIGNILLLALALAAPNRNVPAGVRGVAFLAPGYWLLISAAAYVALFQLVTRPHYWEKTAHMISAEARARRDAALERARRPSTLPPGEVGAI